MYTKDKIKQLLDAHNITYTWYDHIPVFCAEDSEKVQEIIPDWKFCAKNLFLRDEKAKNYYLVTVLKHKKVDLKELAKILGCRRLSFANPTELMNYLGIMPGSVAPFTKLNDTENVVASFIDRDFIESDFIVCHPNLNDASVAIATSDLRKLLTQYDIHFEPIVIPE